MGKKTYIWIFQTTNNRDNSVSKKKKKTFNSEH